MLLTYSPCSTDLKQRIYVSMTRLLQLKVGKYGDTLSENVELQKDRRDSYLGDVADLVSCTPYLQSLDPQTGPRPISETRL